ncbi:glycosyl hydrolase [Niveomyces insectorum RCEF 264]|uniref:Glycosyl hydrolase n=1 Tax=Niveomyces insectorum RCEF 264 TaxID=1081102 RepID=A0A167WGP2_9HYPO|nr:glycosyl hydrolase [Niveomyces insectorum RCEF 264]
MLTGGHLIHADNLPAVTVQCHASNLLELPNGTLLCAWFGGTQEGLPDVSIYLSRFSPTSGQWTVPVKVSTDLAHSEQNPVLFRDPLTDTLWLFHTAQPGGNQEDAIVVARTSDDEGHTWAPPFVPFPKKKGIFVRQPLVVLPDGTWVLPIFYCRTTPGFRWVGNDDISAVLWTDDCGKTWSEAGVPDSIGCVHMAIVALPPVDGYVAFYRSRWADHIYRSTSSDGIHWTPPAATTLPNPNSGIAAAPLPNGAIVLVFNQSQACPSMERRLGLYDDITPSDDRRKNQPDNVHGKTAIWGTPRSALSVGLSLDGGLTWACRVLEDGDGYCMNNNSRERTNHELSYPSLSVPRGSSKGVHIAYTYHRQNIRHVYIDDVNAFVHGF